MKHDAPATFNARTSLFTSSHSAQIWLGISHIIKYWLASSFIPHHVYLSSPPLALITWLCSPYKFYYRFLSLLFIAFLSATYVGLRRTWLSIFTIHSTSQMNLLNNFPCEFNFRHWSWFMNLNFVNQRVLQLRIFR